MDGIHVSKYTDAQREGLLRVWEESALATHDFLKPQDFRAIRAAVQTVDFNLFDVYSLTENSRVIGFPGGAEGKVDFFGKGLGKKLLRFAVHDLHADIVDVNEENRKAVEFYKRFGFDVYERTGKDDLGRDPLLLMRFERKRP